MQLKAALQTLMTQSVKTALADIKSPAINPASMLTSTAAIISARSPSGLKLIPAHASFGEVRIMGSKSNLLQTLAAVAGTGTKLGPIAHRLPSFVPTWRALQESNLWPQD